MGFQVRFLKANPEWCMGCKNCELACTSRKMAKANNSPKYEVKTNIHIIQSDEIKFPVYCEHCEDAYCKEICPVNAIENNNGVIYLNTEKCIGCEMCVQACPYGVIDMRKADNKKIASKCDMCLDRQKNNLSPACYSACPVKALELI
jgi:Fe-S-cluster-containing hydrogenase component 2